jgi:hypothetical protein
VRTVSTASARTSIGPTRGMHPALEPRHVSTSLTIVVFTGSLENPIDDGVAHGPTNVQTLIDEISPTGGG